MKRFVLSAFALALCALPADAGFFFGFRRVVVQPVVVQQQVVRPVVAVQAQPVLKVRAGAVKVRVR